MKNITLEWRGLGYLDVFQAQVNLYDENDFLFSTTTYNGKMNVCLETNKVYKIVAISQNEILRTILYIDPCREKYTFTFPRSIYPRMITFQLTDFYYKNLPIEKGEIILWPK